MKLQNKSVILALGLLLAAATFVWAKKVPAVSIKPDAAFFSPDGSGLQDQVSFQVTLDKIKSVSQWELTVHDGSKLLRKKISGAKKLPPAILWDGFDIFGAPSPEGSYEVVLTVWNEDNEPVRSEPVKIAVDLTPPTISIAAPVQKILVKDGTIPPIVFNLSAVDLSGIARWQIEMRDVNRNPFSVITSTWALPLSWTLPLEKAMIPLGRMSAVFSVTDMAGNVSVSAPQDLEVTDKAGQAAFPDAEKKSDGKFLQLTSIISLSDLFGGDANEDTQLLPQAAVLLKPLASVLLDSPGSKAVVLGHVDPRPEGQDDKSLSSYFAWKIYSYFVRERGVDKNAVSVKGLGADVPIAENKTKLGRSRNRRIEVQIFLPMN